MKITSLLLLTTSLMIVSCGEPTSFRKQEQQETNDLRWKKSGVQKDIQKEKKEIEGVQH